MAACQATDDTIRNNELCTLLARDHVLDCMGLDPYATPFDGLTLRMRKGWSRKEGKIEVVEGQYFACQQFVTILDANGVSPQGVHTNCTRNR